MIIYRFTGNPFVDTGIGAIMAYCGRKRPEDITIEDVEKTAKLLEEIYPTPGWSKNLFSVFPNSAITNPSFKTMETKKVKLKHFLDGLIDEVSELHDNGNCIACGSRDTTKTFSKTYVPLTGSGSLRNFFSFGIDGADYCSTCALAIQASPLAYYMCGKLMLVHSSSIDVIKNWAKICITEINRQRALNDLKGCYNDGYVNPVNAVFHIANRIIDEFESEIDDGVEINVYYFTNYNQGPELNIYRIPGKIFTFLKHINYPLYKSNWQKIIKKGYNIENNKKVDPENEETYKNLTNSVYSSLLEGNSILRYFFNKGKREVIGDFKMLSIYLREVEEMDNERIEVIKKVADKIAEHIVKTDNVRRLTKLERAGSLHDFRTQLLIITKEMLKLEESEGLLTFDEYINHLFPEGKWRDTQDLILFRIYERLFEWLKNKDIQELTEDMEVEEK